MVVHNTPRMVYQQVFRGAWRSGGNWQRKLNIKQQAYLNRNKRMIRAIGKVEANRRWEEAVAINKQHGIGGPENNSLRRVKGKRGQANTKGKVRKITLPKLSFMED